MRVAGLAPVEVPGIENINVTELVPGHMAYRAAMPKLLREVGWMVESDEFTEIEDPDPENHEKRQRELINEIEEARKELEKKNQEQKKGGFSFWRRKKAQKKEWEVYDEKSQTIVNKEDDPAKIAENPVIFDIDAIKAEVAALSSAEEIEVKEIKSTLPPMKIDISQTSPNPYASLRETKSYNDSLAAPPPHHGSTTPTLSPRANSTPSAHSPAQKHSFEEYDEFDDAPGMTMTFDSSFNEPLPPASKSPLPSYQSPPKEPSWDPPSSLKETSERPPLRPSVTEPAPNVNLTPGYNAWADEFEDEFGKGGEMKMTFE